MAAPPLIRLPANASEEAAADGLEPRVPASTWETSGKLLARSGRAEATASVQGVTQQMEDSVLLVSLLPNPRLSNSFK